MRMKKILFSLISVMVFMPFLVSCDELGEISQNIVTIYYKEWIELFKHLNYTMKYISDEVNKDYLLLKEEYQILLVYYFIVITEGQN